MPDESVSLEDRTFSSLAKFSTQRWGDDQNQPIPTFVYDPGCICITISINDSEDIVSPCRSLRFCNYANCCRNCLIVLANKNH